MTRHFRGPYTRAPRQPRHTTFVDWESLNPSIEDFAKTHYLGVREVQCVVAAAHGMSNQMIADELDIAIDTVKTHLRHLFPKIRVNDRAQAVHWLWKQGFPFARDAA